MSDRHRDEPAHLRVPRSRAQLIRILWGRVAALGLMVSGAATMGMATLDAPASAPGHFRLTDDQTLLPVPADTGCAATTVPAIITTVSLPVLPQLSTCTSTRTSALTSSIAPVSPVITSGGTSTSQPGSSAGTARSASTSAPQGSSSSASTRDSRTAAGVLGADAGTPSTGTDIAFGIGIGLVIAGAGIGTGTGAYLKRRRSTD